MTTHEVLVEARNRIERDGWWQRTPYNAPVGAACAGVALNEAAPRDSSLDPVVRALAQAAGVDGASTGAIVLWNDTPGRTKEEVLAAFDKAIAATAPEPDTSFLSKPLRDPVPA